MQDKRKKQQGKVPSEIGSIGVYSRNSRIYLDTTIKDLTFPYSLNTYDYMSMNDTIASALIAVTTIANRVPIYIESYDQTKEHQDRADFVRQCFNDMDDGETLNSVVQKALTSNKYGFSVLEKVFRFRRFDKGSKYDDNKIGIKYLPMRRQHSIDSFEWDANFRKVKGLYQNTTETFQPTVMNPDRRINLKNGKGNVFIPRDKFLLFKADTSTDLPQSVSPLFHCYDAWRELQNYKDLENIAASKNMNGILVGYVPSAYLDEEADDDMKAVGAKFKESLSNLTINEQGSIVIPSEREETGAREWEVSTLQSSSSHVTSITQMVKNKENSILQLLFADILRSGDDVVVANKNKKSLLNTVVEIRIKDILSVLNTDLLPELFRRNGWDDTNLPLIKYGEIEDVDVAEFAKAMQQLRATRLIPITPSIINRILEVMGFQDRLPTDMTQQELDKVLGVEDKVQSKSGSGLDTEGEGTSKSPSEDDKSASNLGNK